MTPGHDRMPDQPIHATDDVSEIKEAVAIATSSGRSGKVLIVPRH